jgi:hypothetical protein
MNNPHHGTNAVNRLWIILAFRSPLNRKNIRLTAVFNKAENSSNCFVNEFRAKQGTLQGYNFSNKSDGSYITKVQTLSVRGNLP